MYKVFPVEGGYQIFWCPHYNDPEARTEEDKLANMRPASKKVYPQDKGAYRRAKQLNEASKQTDEMISKDRAIIL